MDDIQHTTLFKVLIMTKQEIISLARKNGVSTHVLHAMAWADQLILEGNRVLCLHDSPDECDTSFDISKK